MRRRFIQCFRKHDLARDLPRPRRQCLSVQRTISNQGKTVLMGMQELQHEDVLASWSWQKCHFGEFWKKISILQRLASYSSDYSIQMLQQLTRTDYRQTSIFSSNTGVLHKKQCFQPHVSNGWQGAFSV